MVAKIGNYFPLLNEAIAEAKAAGLETEARELEENCFIAFTTSTEMLYEQGVAIRRFLKAYGDRLPRATRRKLKACLTETELVYGGWRGLLALLRRPRMLE